MASPPDSEETPCCPRTSDSVNNATGKVPLKQYRRQSTIDLANRSVRADSVEEFLNGLLPFRPGRNSNLHRPTLTTNPFNRLKDVDSLLETQVVELFVSAIVVFCVPWRCAQAGHFDRAMVDCTTPEGLRCPRTNSPCPSSYGSECSRRSGWRAFAAI